MANKIGDHLQALGVRIITDCEPLEIKKIEDGTPARIQVRAGKADSPPNHEEVYNTVILAIGREPSTKALRIEHAAKVELGPTGKILVNPQDQSSVPSIYAVGDVAEGRPELATIAIHSGKLLAQRLFSTNPRITTLTNYTDVPTTVFTPLEYGCIGISEEDARSNYDFSKLAVYQGNFQPLEFVVPGKFPSTCFLKLICRKPKEEVIGLHYLGPSAGEVVQGFALAFKLKATKADYDGKESYAAN
jgi:thioredoxin reductase (NADPH)